MGSVNAPHYSNRLTYGNQEDVLRSLPPFAGTDRCNDITDPSFDASRSAIVRTTPSGGPSAELTTHMDDSLLSGASYGHTWSALCVHVRTASRQGIRISWEKVTPPRRAGSTYSGFEVRRGQIPASSVAPASRFVEFAIRASVVSEIRALIGVVLKLRMVPRLTLARLAGKIQSNSPIVKSFCPHLRKLYDAFAFGDRGPSFWSEEVLPPLSMLDNLRMIDDILVSGRGRLRVFESRKSFALMWTDGSGVGTGGCAYLEDLSSVSTWSADWAPSFRHFSSNMKELMSVQVAVRRQLRIFNKYGSCLMARRVVLHYTDNVVTAGILRNGSSTNPDLLAVARSIMSMCSEMEAEFIVVHVSGKRMIEQGTDGLSRDAKTGPVAAEQWRLALQPIVDPALRSTWHQVLSKLLDAPLVVREQSAAPSELAGACSLFFASPWVVSTLAERILIAQNMDLKTMAVVVIPRRCQQLFSRSLRRFVLLPQVLPGGPLWSESELEPLCVYVLRPFTPPPPLTDRYLAKNAKRHRAALRQLRAAHQATLNAEARTHGDILRELQLLPHDVQPGPLLAELGRLLAEHAQHGCVQGVRSSELATGLQPALLSTMSVDWLPKVCWPNLPSVSFVPARQLPGLVSTPGV
jgi:hypothetical protein